MGHLNTSLRFSQWALEAVVSLPPLIFAFSLAGISLVWAWIKQRPFKRRVWKQYHWLASSHLLFFMAAIAVAVFYAGYNEMPPAATTLCRQPPHGCETAR
jgi:amino acid transporter